MKRDVERRALAARNIDDDGNNLVIRAYPELNRAVTELARRWTRRRKRAGESIPPGEQRGHSYYMGRVMCWLLSLSDEDQGRIQDEGGQLLEELHALGAEYDGGLPGSFRQRDGSVLVAEKPGAGADGRGGVVHPRPVGGSLDRPADKDRRRKRQTAGRDLAAVSHD